MKTDLVWQAEIILNYAAMIASEVLTLETVSELRERNGRLAAIGNAVRRFVRSRLAPQIGVLAVVGGISPSFRAVGPPYPAGL